MPFRTHNFLATVPTNDNNSAKRLLFHLVEMRASWFVYVSEAAFQDLTELHVALPPRGPPAGSGSSGGGGRAAAMLQQEPTCAMGTTDGLGSQVALSLAKAEKLAFHVSVNFDAVDEDEQMVSLRGFIVSQCRAFFRKLRDEGKQKLEEEASLETLTEKVDKMALGQEEPGVVAGGC